MRRGNLNRERVLDAFADELDRLASDTSPIVRVLAAALAGDDYRRPTIRLFGDRLRFVLLFVTYEELVDNLTIPNSSAAAYRRWARPIARRSAVGKRMHTYKAPRDSEHAKRELAHYVRSTFIPRMKRERADWRWRTKPYVYDKIIEAAEYVFD